MYKLMHAHSSSGAHTPSRGPSRAFSRCSFGTSGKLAGLPTEGREHQL